MFTLVTLSTYHHFHFPSLHYPDAADTLEGKKITFACGDRNSSTNTRIESSFKVYTDHILLKASHIPDSNFSPEELKPLHSLPHCFRLFCGHSYGVGAVRSSVVLAIHWRDWRCCRSGTRQCHRCPGRPLLRCSHKTSQTYEKGETTLLPHFIIFKKLFKGTRVVRTNVGTRTNIHPSYEGMDT